jgi:AraC family transcriptional regulator
MGPPHPPSPGSNPRLLARRQAGTLSAHHKAYPPAFRQTRHEHPTASIDFVLAGAGAGDCGRTRIESVPGAVEFFPAQTAHDFAAAHTGIRTLHIVIPPDWLTRAGVCHDLPGQTLPAEYFAGSCLSVLCALTEPDDAGSLDLESGIAELLDLLADRTRPRTHSVHARRAAAVLHDRSDEALTLSCLADAVGLDPGHLARVFRRTHGVSVGVYQRGLRLRRAAALLAAGREPIARIATTCGFADQAHLTNHFRRTFGVTPARYRALLAAA